MSRYREVVDKISAQTRTDFGRSSILQLWKLRGLRLPAPVRDFYRQYAPKACAEDQVRLWPIKDIIFENKSLVPGIYVCPLGYVVFATTHCGDAYCFDTNVVDE